MLGRCPVPMKGAVKAVVAVDGVPQHSSRAGNSHTRRAPKVAADRVKQGRQTLLSNRLASQPLVGERWAMGSAVVLGQSNGRLQLQRRRNDGPRHRLPPRQGWPIHLTTFDNVYTIKWVQCLYFCKNSATIELVISVAVLVEHVVNFVDDVFVNANERLSAHKLGNQSDW